VRTRFVTITALVTAAAAAVALAGCGSDTSNGNTSAGTSTGTASPSRAAASTTASPTQKVSGTITVLAAASLTESFTELGKKFEAAHPGVTVKFSFGASSTLAQQINQGAPADVFASASPKNMDQVVKAGNSTGSTVFAKNVMEIAVPPDNPAKVTGIADLAKPGVTVALCQPQVPCGTTAAAAFTKSNVTVKPKTLGADVKAVLTTVELGEVDAGVVYATDVKAAGSKVKGIAIPAAKNASTSYPIAALLHSRHYPTAGAFEAFVLSNVGLDVLQAAGFAAP
jgi:molybdate transport system substrate-binding protein